MSSYLLEEDDGREERTGYLEFKREDSDTWLTIGMGIRARRGKPLDKWYFSLTDGRRVGRDFLLYKDTGEKVTLSRRELENRVGAGGQVFDRQTDYMEYVNRQIFGFETAEEYKEMIDLLIQLRTPKLSKDFKPSVVNDILSDSLQPLSDEDLRPMSEAIENMDTMNMNLKAREEGRIGERERLLAQKKEQLAAKQRQYLDTEEKKKAEENRRYEKEKEMRGLLEQMQEEADSMAFEEHAFFQAELTEKPEETPAWESLTAQFTRTREEIGRGLEVLREVRDRQREADELLHKREKKQREADAAERREGEQEALMTQTAGEWKEALYRWNGDNRELKLAQEQMWELARFADEYREASDFAWVRQQAADRRLAVSGEINGKLQQVQADLRDLEQAHRSLLEELAAWEDRREPEPARSEAVIRNRERLREKGIPFTEFYKTIEFGKNLDKTTCDRLGEALLEMGVLDALVVEEPYREQVLAADPGCADRYLFVEPGHADRNLLNVLDLGEAVNDIFFNQRITGILGNIGYQTGDAAGTDGDGPAVQADGRAASSAAETGFAAEAGPAATAVYPDGSYRLGVLRGTVTGAYEAGFIGAQAREKNRQAKIAACREALAQNEEEQEGLRREEAALKERLAVLRREYEALPGDTDLRTAWRMLDGARRETARLKEECARLEEELLQASENLKELRRQAAEIAGRLYLNCSYETFCQADEAARAYERHLYQLQSGHESYLRSAAQLVQLAERLEELDMDMDQIRSEAGNAQKERKKEQEEYRSVQEQLKLTDYEQIRQRLDECMAWLRDYPGFLRSCVEEKTQKEERIRLLQQQAAENGERIAEYRRREEYLERCFAAVRDLGYVSLPDGSAAGIQDCLSACRDMDKEQIIRSLNQVYFENRGYLTDYQIMQTELFAELDEGARRGDPPAGRLDIAARYQGVRIPFGRLLVHLNEEIEELKSLIRAGDRELFEDILANTVSRKIRAKINGSTAWVEKMNALMGEMNTSSGLKLSLRWRSRTAEAEDQLNTKELVELLKKDYRLMREDEAAKLSAHFRSKVEEARRRAGDSGGEKAMAMYVPLFSAVVAKYQGGRPDGRPPADLPGRGLCRRG